MLTRFEFLLAGTVVAMAAAALAWNAFVGMNWTPALWKLLVFPAILILITVYYRRVWPIENKIAEATFYVALWLIFPLFGVHLTYLATALGFPYQDQLFLRADRALGFDWAAWRHYVVAHPWLFAVQSAAYSSSVVQPFLLVALLTWRAPAGRNAELLGAILLALIITVFVMTFCPAQGPAYYAGIATNYDTLLPAIRAKTSASLPYNGVVWFPSFHTVMAILFTWSLRGRWWVFSGFAINNAIMILATLAVGDHYLIDVLGGAVVAAFAMFAASKAVRVEYIGVACSGWTSSEEWTPNER